MNQMVIFISYAHADAEFAAKLTGDLKGVGVEVRIDEKALSVGDSITEFVETSISECDFFCMILSSASVERPWVKREYRAALSLQLSSNGKKPRILPIVKEQCAIPVLLRDILYADFTKGYPRAFEALQEAITKQRLDQKRALEVLGPAPFFNLIELVSDQTLMVILSHDPEASGLPRKLCNDIYDEVIRSTNLLVSELGNLTTNNLCIKNYTENHTSRLGVVNAVEFPKIWIHQNVEYLSFMDEVDVTYSFSLSLGFLIHKAKKHPELVKSRSLYLLPQKVEWTSDGTYPDGASEGLELSVIEEGKLFPNRDKWKSKPPVFG